MRPIRGFVMPEFQVRLKGQLDTETRRSLAAIGGYQVHYRGRKPQGVFLCLEARDPEDAEELLTTMGLEKRISMITSAVEPDLIP